MLGPACFVDLGAGGDERGVVHATRISAGAGGEAFIWGATNGMQNLGVLLTTLGVDLTGWQLSSTNGISADGRTIVGYGTNPSGPPEAWIAVIPEPGTAILVSLGLVGLASVRRRS